MKKELLLFFVFFSLGMSLFAQKENDDKALFYLKNATDSVRMRWIIIDFDTWLAAIDRGYDIYREELSTGDLSKVNDSIVKAMSLDDWGYRNMVFNDSIGELDPNIDKHSVEAITYLYPEETGLTLDLGKSEEDNTMDFGDDPRAVMHMLHSIATIYSREAAYVSGYTFADSLITPNTDYKYYLCLGGEKPDKALASAVINSSDSYPDLTPEILADRTNKGQTFLFWQKPDTLGAEVGLYEIYRSQSEDGGYEPIAEPALLAKLDLQQGKDDLMKYNDATLEKDQVYYYKIRSIDMFGDSSNFSKPYRVVEKTFLSSTPSIKEASTSPTFDNTIKWEIEDYDVENIKTLRVFRNSSSTGDYQPISDELGADARSFTDTATINTNYYKVRAIGLANDTVWSALRFVNIPDSIPPSAPVFTSALCDSLGIVTLKWRHGAEPDMQQIKVYTANYVDDEYSLIADLGVDTIYSDTISLGVMGKSVFYKLVAFDKSYNPSDFSEPAEVLRYDTIPPNPPIITEIKGKPEGIFIKWACSSSPDVEESILLRMTSSDTAWTTLSSFEWSDTLEYQTYLDTAVIKGGRYQYTLQASDAFGLTSVGGRTLTIDAHDDGLRKPIARFSGTLNKRKHTVKLEWEYNQSKVEKFIIYRRVNDSVKEVLVAPQSAIREYYDEATGQGNIYTYSMKAVYLDGAESPITEDVIVEY